jgi:DHA2 family multidrug resistance protein-like MFS transporter
MPPLLNRRLVAAAVARAGIAHQLCGMVAQPANPTAPNTAEDGLPTPQRYWAILTLMVGLAMSCLDTAIVNVALPTIAKDLHADPAD